ncbi:MAG TPA: DUF1330 domain-containing protein [Pseudolabrys sp.]|jgi:uncharacterized protein (DUF1330 family)|nr:DUF1330 domain-containing protein [Pseudolabrys sp.]
MKTRYTVALSMLAGALLGATAIQGLHAQAKPRAFVVAEVDVTNQEGFIKEYVPLAVKALTESGSKPVVRGGKTATIEGAPPKRVVINSFDSLEQAVAAYNSAAYKEARKVGNKYATFRVYAAEALAQ